MTRNLTKYGNVKIECQSRKVTKLEELLKLDSIVDQAQALSTPLSPPPSTPPSHTKETVRFQRNILIFGYYHVI